MTRAFTTGMLALLYAASASDPILALLTVTHPSLTTRRHVRDHQDVTSNSVLYTAAAFDIELPDESDDRQPQAKLVIDTVDQSLIADLIAISTPATVTIEIVFVSDPDTVVATWEMEARAARWTALSAEVELFADPVLDEPWPGITYSPMRFPGLFDA